MWAVDKQEVKEIIEKSISKYKSKDVRHYVESFIMNMLADLEDQRRGTGHSLKAIENMTHAIEILKKLSSTGYGYIF